MLNLGMGEITVILLLALIFLGPSKLPDLAAGLGKLIREIRKATSDVKNEIALDETFRKPFEDLRDAVTLHPDELKRRDQWAREREEAARRAAEEAAREAAAAGPETVNGVPVPPDGLADHVKLEDVSKPVGAKLPEPNGPNATIVQPAIAQPAIAQPAIAQPAIAQAPPPRAAALPRGATLDDVPTPPPEVEAKPPAPPVPARLFDTVAPAETPTEKPTEKTTQKSTKVTAKPKAPEAGKPPGGPPTGTVARPETLRGVKPVPAAPPAAASTSNVTQILREEDLIPSASSGTPPPPPHLPGLRPMGAPRVTPPLPTPATDKKKP